MAPIKKTLKQDLGSSSNKNSISADQGSEGSTAKKASLISNITREINKAKGERIAFNLNTDEDAPTNVKNWYTTSAVKLDYIISNKRGGGIPEGRII